MGRLPPPVKPLARSVLPGFARSWWLRLVGLWCAPVLCLANCAVLVKPLLHAVAHDLLIVGVELNGVALGEFAHLNA